MNFLTGLWKIGLKNPKNEKVWTENYVKPLKFQNEPFCYKMQDVKPKVCFYKNG